MREKQRPLLFLRLGKEVLGNYRQVSLSSNSGKVKEQLIQDTISRHKLMDKKIIRSRKSHLTYHVSFYNKNDQLDGSGKQL